MPKKISTKATDLAISCLIDGSTEDHKITLEEAAYTLQCWKEEGGELAEGTEDLTAEEFMEAWNSYVMAAV